ncbi:hypothetical protein BJX64DRAFT_8441 [Aspergillus heterothallicus]
MVPPIRRRRPLFDQSSMPTYTNPSETTHMDTSSSSDTGLSTSTGTATHEPQPEPENASTESEAERGGEEAADSNFVSDEDEVDIKVNVHIELYYEDEDEDENEDSYDDILEYTDTSSPSNLIPANDDDQDADEDSYNGGAGNTDATIPSTPILANYDQGADENIYDDHDGAGNTDTTIPSAPTSAYGAQDAALTLVELSSSGRPRPRASESGPDMDTRAESGPGSESSQSGSPERDMDTRPDSGPSPRLAFRQDHEYVSQREQGQYEGAMATKGRTALRARHGEISETGNDGGNEPRTSEINPRGRRASSRENGSSAQAQRRPGMVRNWPYPQPAQASGSGSGTGYSSGNGIGSSLGSTSAFASVSSSSRRIRPAVIRSGGTGRHRSPDTQRSKDDDEDDGEEEEVEQRQSAGALVSCGIRHRPSESRSRSRSPDRENRPRHRYTSADRRTMHRHAAEERQLVAARRHPPQPQPQTSPSSSSQGPRIESTTPETERCAFASCTAHLSGQDIHLRKIVSHIFGRNKNATKKIPDEIWVRYCRKHYQRARYRAGADEGDGTGNGFEDRNGNGNGHGVNNRGKNWAKRQCEFILDALRRMKGLGNVQGFRVWLRKREARRIEGGYKFRRVARDGDASTSAPDGFVPGYRAPAQDTRDAPVPASDPNATGVSNSFSANKKKKKKQKQTAKQKRPAVAAPVPEWLIMWIEQHEDQILSFDMVMDLVRRVQMHIKNVVLGPNEEVRFPDIEILPVFTETDSLASTDSSETASPGTLRSRPGLGDGDGLGSDQASEQSPASSGTSGASRRVRRERSGVFSGFSKQRRNRQD